MTNEQKRILIDEGTDQLIRFINRVENLIGSCKESLESEEFIPDLIEKDFEWCFKKLEHAKSLLQFNSDKVNSINDINLQCEDGKLLLSSIALITTKYETSMTPQEVLEEIISRCNFTFLN